MTSNDRAWASIEQAVKILRESLNASELKSRSVPEDHPRLSRVEDKLDFS